MKKKKDASGYYLNSEIYPKVIILTSLVLVHAGYLFCNWYSLNTNYYETMIGGIPGSFNSSHINACCRNRNLWTSVFSLFQRSRAEQTVAPKGIQTKHFLHTRQAPYPFIPIQQLCWQVSWITTGQTQWSRDSQLDLWSSAGTGAEVQFPLPALILLRSPWVMDLLYIT